ncbi:MAG TPA: SDR family NAD(P)-dependent oxidoreductase [Candidatus Acidoferrales bacterium]
MKPQESSPCESLAGQAALVTGGSRGIGLAIARRLMRLKARVAICARDAATLRAAAERLSHEGGEVFPFPADLRRPGEIAALVERVHAALGPLSILVNNAGVGVFGQAIELSEADWDSVLDTNLKAVFLLCRAVAPEMIRHRSGHIINISSLAGKNAFAGGAIYCSSKWGLQGFSYCLAEELRGHGIRVSVVCPGTVATEFSPHTGKDSAKMLQPDDVAHAVEMLLTQAPQSFISEVLLRPAQKP